MEDDDTHQPQAHDLKGQGRKVMWSVWAVLAQWTINQNE